MNGNNRRQRIRLNGRETKYTERMPAIIPDREKKSRGFKSIFSINYHRYPEDNYKRAQIRCRRLFAPRRNAANTEQENTPYTISVVPLNVMVVLPSISTFLRDLSK